MEATRTPTELPVNLNPWMVTVACGSPAVASILPVTSKPYWLTPVVMVVPPTPGPCPTSVSSLLMVAPTKVPAAIDGVAVGGRVDRGLDGGVAAVADEQEVVAGAVVDLLDAGEKVGAVRAGIHLPAGLVAGGGRVAIGDGGNVRRRQRAGIDRRVSAGAAYDRVVAGEAGEHVVTRAAVQLVVARGPGKGHPVDVSG